MRTCSKFTASRWQSRTSGPGLLTPHHAVWRNTVLSQLRKERGPERLRMWGRFLRDGSSWDGGEQAARMTRQQETREVTETEKGSIFRSRHQEGAHSGQSGCSESSDVGV